MTHQFEFHYCPTRNSLNRCAFCTQSHRERIYSATIEIRCSDRVGSFTFIYFFVCLFVVQTLVREHAICTFNRELLIASYQKMRRNCISCLCVVRVEKLRDMDAIVFTWHHPIPRTHSYEAHFNFYSHFPFQFILIF